VAPVAAAAAARRAAPAADIMTSTYKARREGVTPGQPSWVVTLIEILMVPAVLAAAAAAGRMAAAAAVAMAAAAAAAMSTIMAAAAAGPMTPICPTHPKRPGSITATGS
jgi:hypothetical protein